MAWHSIAVGAVVWSQVPDAASPRPRPAPGALLRTAGTPRSFSKETQRRIWAPAPLLPCHEKAVAGAGCPPGAPCTHTDVGDSPAFSVI